MYDEIRNQYIKDVEAIEEIDSQLGTKPGRTTILNGAVNGRAVEAFDQFENEVATLAAEEVVGLLHLIAKSKTFKQMVDDYVTANTPEDNDDTVSDETKVALVAQRSEIQKRAASVYKALESLSAIDNLPDLPGALRGPVGKQGPRLKGAFSYTVNGEPINAINLSQVGNAVGCKAADIKSVMSETYVDFDFENPPSTWDIRIKVDSEDYHIVATSATTEDDELDEMELDD